MTYIQFINTWIICKNQTSINIQVVQKIRIWIVRINNSLQSLILPDPFLLAWRRRDLMGWFVIFKSVSKRAWSSFKASNQKFPDCRAAAVHNAFENIAPDFNKVGGTWKSAVCSIKNHVQRDSIASGELNVGWRCRSCWRVCRSRVWWYAYEVESNYSWLLNRLCKLSMVRIEKELAMPRSFREQFQKSKYS